MASGSLLRRTSGILGIALVLQATSAASLASIATAAPNSPRVLLVPLISGEGATEKQANKFSGLLLDDLKTRDDQLVAVQAEKGKSSSGSTGSAPTKGGGGPQVAQKALDLINDGQAQLNDLKFDEAVVTLQKGIDLMLTDPAHALYDRVLEAYVSMAVAYFRTGDEKKAQNALFAVARLAPTYQLPEGKYPPVFVRELDKMKRRADKAVKGTVNIEGPMGATAFIDGRDLGMVPVSEENVPVGMHYVKVEGTHGERFGQVLDLKGTSAKVKAVFQGAPAPVEKTPVEEAPQNPMPSALLDANAVYRLAQACKAANAEYAIVGYVFRKSDNQLSANAAVFSAKKQAFSVAPTVTFDADLLTANVEAFKLAEALSGRLTKFEATPLPHNLAGKGASSVAVVTPKDKPKDNEVVAEVQTRKPVVVPEEKKPVVADEPRKETTDESNVRALRTRSVVEGETPNSVDNLDLTGPIEKQKRIEEDEGGVAWWVWAAVGVAVVGAAGGTYYGVSQATKPVTGTVTARW